MQAGTPLVIERLGLFEVLAAWWWGRIRRRGSVFALEPTPLMAALPRLSQRAGIRWLGDTFPHVLPEGLRLAFAMCERFGADTVRRDARYKVLSRHTRFTLDLTLAIKKTLIQRYWQARGHFAVLVQAVADENRSGHVRLWAEV